MSRTPIYLSVSKLNWSNYENKNDRCGSGEDYVKAFTDNCLSHNLRTGLYYSPMDWRFEYLIRMLVNAVGRNGNLLLNVGPDKNGDIPEKTVSTLKMIGEWLKIYGESIYETRVGFAPVDDVYVSTQRDNAIYIHILDVKKFDKITLPALDKKILSTEILKGEKLDFVQNDNGIKITLSEYALRNNAVDTIVKITVE